MSQPAQVPTQQLQKAASSFSCRPLYHSRVTIPREAVVAASSSPVAGQKVSKFWTSWRYGALCATPIGRFFKRLASAFLFWCWPEKCISFLSLQVSCPSRGRQSSSHRVSEPENHGTGNGGATGNPRRLATDNRSGATPGLDSRLHAVTSRAGGRQAISTKGAGRAA